MLIKDTIITARYNPQGEKKNQGKSGGKKEDIYNPNVVILTQNYNFTFLLNNCFFTINYSFQYSFSMIRNIKTILSTNVGKRDLIYLHKLRPACPCTM